MLRIVLALQLLILLMFGYFVLNIQSTVNELSLQLETALLVVEEIKTVPPGRKNVYIYVNTTRKSILDNLVVYYTNRKEKY